MNTQRSNKWLALATDAYCLRLGCSALQCKIANHESWVVKVNVARQLEVFELSTGLLQCYGTTASINQHASLLT